MDTQNWKENKGYINLSPSERDMIDKLMLAGRSEDAWKQIRASELKLKRGDLMANVAGASGHAADILSSDPGYDVGDRIDPLTSGDRTRSVGLSALDAASKGAQGGALFGPAGMAIGAGVGALVGAFKGRKANKEAEKDILSNRIDRNSTLAMKREAEREAELKTGAVQYVSDGGFIEGKGGPTDDMNPGRLDPGDFVIPAGTTPMAKQMVKDLAKVIKEDKPKKKMHDGDRPVRLSKGELVVPKEKVPFAEELLGKMGTSLEDIRDQTLLERESSNKTPERTVNAGRPMRESYFNKQNRDFVPMATGGEVPSWLEPSAMLTQTASGLIQQRRAENEIKKNLERRKKRAREAEGEAFVAKGKSDQIVNRSFRDTERTIKGLKRDGARTMAMNSLNPQDYNQNVSGLIADLAETTSKANIEKSNALTQNELQRMSTKSGVNSELNALDQSGSGFQVAKATQGATKAQAGIQGAYDMIKGRKDELARKRREVELVERAKAMGSEYEMARIIKSGDVDSLINYYKKMGIDINEEEAVAIMSSDPLKQEAKNDIPSRIKPIQAKMDIPFNPKEEMESLLRSKSK